MEFYHKNNIAIGSLDLTSVFVVDDNVSLFNLFSTLFVLFQPLRIKLSQAGMCYIFGDYYHNIRMALNAIHYQPPEYLLNLLPKGDHSAYYWTDIWSFGIILIELFTGWRLAEMLDGRQFLSILSSILFKSKILYNDQMQFSF
jgi:serine/threonine protein kinase